ncbi:MAG: O-antigen ligase family protein [Victivallales bacterium]|nr:O-antigen ligase family protein [Victivallales bacterium]
MELKHIIFFFSLCGIAPLALACMVSKTVMRACVFSLPLILAIYQLTAINFGNPLDYYYRGTAQGFEFSLIHMIVFSILIAMLVKQWPLKILIPGVIIYSLYYFICVLSLINSPDFLFSSFELWKMLAFFIVFLTLANYFHLTHDYDSFIYGLAALVIILFYEALMQKYFYGRVQVKSYFPHQNSLGMFVCLVGPVFLARCLNNKDGLFKTLFFLFVFFASFAMSIFTYSRGTVFGFPFGCAITVFFSTVLNFKTKTIYMLLVMIILGTFVVAYCFPRIISRFENASSASKNTRIMLAVVATNIMKDKPFVGCGVNTWTHSVAKPQYNPFLDPANKSLSGEVQGIVETIYLLVGAECGFLGLIMLLCWFFYYLFHALLQGFRWRKTQYFYIMVGLLGGLASNYLQSTLEWVLKQPINFCVLFCCFAMLSSFIQGSRNHTFLSQLEILDYQRREAIRRQEEKATLLKNQQP